MPTILKKLICSDSAPSIRATRLLAPACALVLASVHMPARADNQPPAGPVVTAPAAGAPAPKKDAAADSKSPAPAGSTTGPASPPAAEPAKTRALPQPFESPPFPVADWTLNNGFPIGENWDVAPGSLERGLFGHKLDASRITVTGWLDAGMEVSTSHTSNLPTTYNLIPNHLELDQLVLEIQRQPDTVQKDHIDWGFMSAHLFGIDYRFTQATGWADTGLYKNNNLYGYDPVLQNFMVYFPKIADGAVLQVGRYISPIDIEAQLSLQNFLYSHSLMFGVDPYTYTAVNMQIRINKCLQFLVGVNGGNENVWWSGAPVINGEFLLGWNAADNKDQIWGGLDSIGSGADPGVKNTPSGPVVTNPLHVHDNEQIFNVVWGHKFNDKWFMENQYYYEWMYNAPLGGTPIFGGFNGVVPPTVLNLSQPNDGLTIIPGKSHAAGWVCYAEHKISKTEYISLRPGFLSDPQGWRTGYPNDYLDLTFGYARWITPNIIIRPEINYARAFTSPAWDNGTRWDQLMVGGDIIMKF